MKHAITLLTLCCAFAAAFAQPRRQHVPAVPTPFDYVQPDGDTLSIRLRGDERHSYRTTLDGYLIRQNDKGYYCYARYDKHGNAKATRRKAHNAEKRSVCEQKYIRRHIPNKLQAGNTGTGESE